MNKDKKPDFGPHGFANSNPADRHGAGNLDASGAIVHTWMNILALRNRDSRAVETCNPDTETALDWLDYHS